MTKVKKIAVIGAGISGVSVARILKDKGHDVTVYEKENQCGGLVKCSIEKGVLFHRVGGHVFNTKNSKVSKWFWELFSQDEFISAKRHAKVFLGDRYIGYPIEDHLYELEKETTSSVISELLHLEKNSSEITPDNFSDFLKLKFGETLFRIYFGPYNNKIWQTDLFQIPLEWLDGKLPMPSIKEILLRNIYHDQETKMVHSTFFYPKKGGSSFLIDRISSGLNIKIANINSIIQKSNVWIVGECEYDSVIYTGDCRALSEVLGTDNPDLPTMLDGLKDLKSNGTTTVLCYTEPCDLSWVYFPEAKIPAHRIIYTGNFSSQNNDESGELTCTVEFSGRVESDVIEKTLKLLPGNLRPIAFNFQESSYVIQESDTRDKIREIKKTLSPKGFHLLGRFAEWEYYNMDKAIEAALEMSEQHFSA